MDSPVVVVATIYPTPEHRDEVVSILNATQAEVHRSERGCELYALHANDDRLVMVEKWADRAALEGHFAAPAFAALGGSLDGKLAGPIDIQELRPVPAGTVEQGQL